MSLTHFSPYEMPMQRAFQQLLSDDFFPHRSLFPYWAAIPNARSLDLGSALGDVQNTPEKFAVNVDVSHFKPDEVKVNLNGNELTIEGNHDEKMDKHGTIKRSFVRKYVLPEDTNLDSLRSSLSDKGHLMIEAHKMTKELMQPRAIPITRG